MSVKIHGPRTWMAGITRGKPFVARFEEVNTSPRWWGGLKHEVVKGVLCRDSLGRVRQESSLPGWFGNTVKLISIADPVRGVVLAADVQRRVYVESPMTFELASTEPAAEGAVTEMVEGFECFRLSASGLEAAPESYRAWISKELNHVVREERSEAGRDFIWRLTAIEQREPDPALLERPSGYRPR